MPFPPSTKDANFDYESALNENVGVSVPFYLIEPSPCVLSIVAELLES